MTNINVSDPMLSLVNRVNAKMKVWDYFKKNMGNWNKLITRQSVMAKELGISRQHISKSLKALEKKNFIQRIGKDQTNVIFMANPFYVWKGQLKDKIGATNMYEKHKEIKNI